MPSARCPTPRARAYAEHGTLLLRRFAPADLLARFREEAATMIGLMLGELGLDAAASRGRRASTAGSICLLAADRARVGRLYQAVRKLPSVYGLITAPRVWAVMRQLMSTRLPGIYPGGAGVRMDHPGEDTYLSPWRQEYPYNLTSDNAVTLWLPLVDVDERNGCLLMAPGTHRLGALPVRVRDALNTRRNANETLEIDGIEDGPRRPSRGVGTGRRRRRARVPHLPAPPLAAQPQRRHPVDAAGALLRLPEPDRDPSRLGGRHERRRGFPPLPPGAGRRLPRSLSRCWSSAAPAHAPSPSCCTNPRSTRR